MTSHSKAVLPRKLCRILALNTLAVCLAAPVPAVLAAEMETAAIPAAVEEAGQPVGGGEEERASVVNGCTLGPRIVCPTWICGIAICAGCRWPGPICMGPT